MRTKHESILDILRYSEQEVRVDEFVSRLGVSATTVRRYLEDLEKEGKLIRTHGGAILRDRVGDNPALLKKRRANLKEKSEIARASLKLIRDHETIILSDGTTTYQIALMLRDSSLELRVITNDLNIALVLADRRQIETIVIGGKITEHHSIGGYLGEKVIESLHNDRSSIDKVFIGADAISLEDGLTGFNEWDAKIAGIMANLAEKVIAVIDHTKFDRTRFFPVLPLEEIDILITDSKITEERVKAYKAKEVSIIVAEPLA